MKPLAFFLRKNTVDSRSFCETAVTLARIIRDEIADTSLIPAVSAPGE